VEPTPRHAADLINPPVDEKQLLLADPPALLDQPPEFREKNFISMLGKNLLTSHLST